MRLDLILRIYGQLNTNRNVYNMYISSGKTGSRKIKKWLLT